MDEIELSHYHNKTRIRQPVSVPFLWEEKPGTPKKDWKPTSQQVRPVRPPPPPPPVKLIASVPFKWEENPGTPKRDWNPTTLQVHPVRQPPPPPPPPLKLIASVPFEWEEKPGKPFPFFSQQQPQELPLLLPAKTTSLRSYELHSQEIDKLWEDGPHSSGGDDGDDEMFESDGYETDNSFSSAPSLLANRLASTTTIAGAVPVLETPPSPASEAGESTSSYATGTTSLVGATFLEGLFPFLPPNSSIVWKESSRTPPPQVPGKDCDRESNCSVKIRNPLTLGELIMMSRRRSYVRKAVQEHNLSMEFMKRSAIGCCNFRTSNRIRALTENWKKQLQLKLI
ncbi:hypothetical protein LguiA_034631 [Lonicera macranthoides]